MCGRYTSFTTAQQIADEFRVLTLSEAARAIEPSWNIPPTTDVRIIVDRHAPAQERYEEDHESHPETDSPVVRAMHAARWGLVPPWAEDLSIGARMINARSETVATRNSFRAPLRTSRCIVVADGYYEWHTDEAGKKTPYYIVATDGSILALAGLFSWWRDPKKDPTTNDGWVLTTTILTAAARDGLEQIHDREPVMLDHDLITPWLDPDLQDPDEVLGLIAHPGPQVSWHAVSPAVGSVRNNTPALITPAPAPVQDTLL